MKTKEEKICSYTQKNYRLQLIRIINNDIDKPGVYIPGVPVNKYQVRENRKIILTTFKIYQARKLFAQMVTNIVLQLKIY